jgi:MATE family multidrug resistance protein
VLALALPPALLFRIYSTLNQALGRPQLVTWLQVGSLFIKLPLSIWFTFGGAGLPAQGVVGCAWATLVVNGSMLALAIWLLRTQDIYEPLRIWRRMEPPHWPTIAGFARLGIPAGLAVMVEVTSFTLMALFIARQGTTASAAHQIAANVAAVLYMVPLSLAIATSARVSYWLGAGDPARARKVVFIGFRLSALIGIALAAILLIAKNHIGGLYSTNTGVLALTGGVIVWVAAYHAADAIQTLCVFVLRCYRITVAPLVVYCVLLWGAGLGGGYLLAYRGLGPWAAEPSPTPFWAASAVALWLTAALFLAMLWRAVRPAAKTRATGSQGR